MRELLRKLVAWLPWDRPTLADLPAAERRRARILMWGAGAHLPSSAVRDALEQADGAEPDDSTEDDA